MTIENADETPIGTEGELLASALGSGPPWFMGILNVTPDSFSDGGFFLTEESAIRRAEKLIFHGAHVIDIGGESTAPDSQPISVSKELERILPVVTTISKKIFVSVDTYKAEVADSCLRAGARMVNDVSALRADPNMASTIEKHGAFIVLMHSKEDAKHPGVTTKRKRYSDVVAEILAFIEERIEYALSSGISRDKIIIDPGMGAFLSHDSKYSWDVLKRLGEITSALPFPMLIGISRKGFLGGKVGDRDPLSQLLGIAAFKKGARILRTHDVQMARSFFSAWKRAM